MYRSIAVATALFCAACSADQVQLAAQGVEIACAEAQAAQTDAAQRVKGGAAASVANVGAYINGACGSAGAIAKVAQDPSTVQWLNNMSTSLKAMPAQTAAPAPAKP